MRGDPRAEVVSLATDVVSLATDIVSPVTEVMSRQLRKAGRG